MFSTQFVVAHTEIDVREESYRNYFELFFLHPCLSYPYFTATYFVLLPFPLENRSVISLCVFRHTDFLSFNITTYYMQVTPGFLFFYFSNNFFTFSKFYRDFIGTVVVAKQQLPTGHVLVIVSYRLFSQFNVSTMCPDCPDFFFIY